MEKERVIKKGNILPFDSMEPMRQLVRISLSSFVYWRLEHCDGG